MPLNGEWLGGWKCEKETFIVCQPLRCHVWFHTVSAVNKSKMASILLTQAAGKWRLWKSVKACADKEPKNFRTVSKPRQNAVDNRNQNVDHKIKRTPGIDTLWNVYWKSHYYLYISHLVSKEFMLSGNTVLNSNCGSSQSSQPLGAWSRTSPENIMPAVSTAKRCLHQPWQHNENCSSNSLYHWMNLVPITNT